MWRVWENVTTSEGNEGRFLLTGPTYIWHHSQMGKDYLRYILHLWFQQLSNSAVF